MPHRLAQRLVAPLLALLVALTGIAVVGSTTAAGAARADFAPMRIGDTGWRVRKLQSRLHQLDLHSEVVTSRFDRETRAGVATFQRRRGWSADGVVDERTWRRITAITTIFLPPRFGAASVSVSSDMFPITWEDGCRALC